MIYTNVDGEVSLSKLSKERLLECMDEEYWGPSPPFKEMEDTHDLAAEAGILIIKGQPVEPRAKKIISEWDID